MPFLGCHVVSSNHCRINIYICCNLYLYIYIYIYIYTHHKYDMEYGIYKPIDMDKLRDHLYYIFIDASIDIYIYFFFYIHIYIYIFIFLETNSESR